LHPSHFLAFWYLESDESVCTLLYLFYSLQPLKQFTFFKLIISLLCLRPRKLRTKIQSYKGP